MKKISLGVILSLLLAVSGYAFPPAPLGQFPADVAITGGTINGTTIGGSTPAAGTFTTVTADALKTTDSVADTTLSGTPKVFVIYDGTTPYYFKAYPTKP